MFNVCCADVCIQLVSSHHHDHAGGNEDMRKAIPGVRIFGGDSRIISTEPVVHDGETIDIAGITVRVLATPCHTKGHVLYHIPGTNANPGHLFTGEATNLIVDELLTKC